MNKKLISQQSNLDCVRDIATKHGILFLGDCVPNHKTKLRFIDCDDRVFTMALDSFKKCRFVRKRHNIDSVRNDFALSNYVLLEEEYKHSNVPMKYVCGGCGGTKTITYGNFCAGKRCNVCVRKKISEDQRAKRFSQDKSMLIGFGYIVLSNEYTQWGKTKHIKCKCINGHIGNINPDVVLRSQKRGTGNGCKQCATNENINKQKFKYDDVKRYFASQGYKLLTDRYENNNQKLKAICPNGHVYYCKYSNFRTGYRCNDCATIERGLKKRLTFDHVKSVVEERGYKLLSKSYNIVKTKLDVVCGSGHNWKVCFQDFQANNCPHCSMTGFSAQEKEVLDFIKSLGVDVDENNKKFLGGKEIDILIPSHKLAIEYCGLYWHSDVHKPTNYHRWKYDECKKRGYRLITIFSDEWVKKEDIVKSRLRQAVSKTHKRVYARKCVVKRVDSSIANSFYEKNHIQGRTRGFANFALFYEDAMVQCLTIGVLSRKHVAKSDTIELKRLCSLNGVSVVGGASRLFKKAKEFGVGNGYKKIRSYCDLRYGNGGVYRALGFEYISESKYTPHYTDNTKRYRNQSMRKTPEERLTGKTERVLRKEQGYNVIWDCGHQTWDYEL